MIEERTFIAGYIRGRAAGKLAGPGAGAGRCSAHCAERGGWQRRQQPKLAALMLTLHSARLRRAQRPVAAAAATGRPDAYAAQCPLAALSAAAGSAVEAKAGRPAANVENSN